jgi:hypothetical protein
MEIPTDGLLIEAMEITADESSMTGRICNFRRVSTFKKEYPTKLPKIEGEILIDLINLRRRLSSFTLRH